MSGDEVLVLLLGGVAAVAAWIGWYVPVARVRGFGVRTRGRGVMASAPPLAALILFAVLKCCSGAPGIAPSRSSVCGATMPAASAR